MSETQTITVACKLKASKEVVQEMDETLLVFASACDWINQNTPPKMTNKTAMQALAYQDVRTQFGLSANLAIQAIRRVCANRKTAFQKKRKVGTFHGTSLHKFNPTSASYDARIFSFREKDWTVSLKLLNSRQRLTLLIGNYQKHLLSGQKPSSAILVKRQDGSYYIHIQVEKPAPPIAETEKVLGVDLGRTDIASTSKGESWSGKQITEKRNHYAKMRATLQKKATKGTRTTRRRCRQLLKRLSGKEKRFQQVDWIWRTKFAIPRPQKHINHEISRNLVQNAAIKGQSIAIEDLTGIRERVNEKPRSKKDKRLSNNWAFYQLRSFLTYKCVLAGVKLILVNPAYTSQTCHKCLHIHPVKGKSYRSGKTYKCKHCGWKGDADYNGAKIIEALGRSINPPRGTGLCCKLEERSTKEYVQLTLWDALGLPKTPPAYAVG
ncbi:transposase [Spirulina sp. 06S082]|uniref:RNA-guided endonuclease InsQ/TnpB family protein n=1 Tax=Spirulina sp. 06S082 TaxID=3110248 RepID=UPI002B21B50D|nr:transposase [Spirulina sp. 06S082]MEA5470322.1 transposase [Spirulina sp. 06S082]